MLMVTALTVILVPVFVFFPVLIIAVHITVVLVILLLLLHQICRTLALCAENKNGSLSPRCRGRRLGCTQ
jgi:hypothetical protein